MKLKISTIAIAALLMAPTLANAATDNQKLMQDFERLMNRTQMLEKQINSLQSKVSSLEQEKRQRSTSAYPSAPIGPAPIAKPMPPSTSSSGTITHRPFVTSRVPAAAASDTPEAESMYPQALQPGDRRDTLEAGAEALTYMAGTPVVSSPYIGDRSAFDGDGLIVNIPKINTDLQLLGQRKFLADSFRKLGYPANESPVVDISGRIITLGYGQRPYTGNERGDFTVAVAELDVMAEITPMVTGFMGLSLDNTPAVFGTVTRVGRSHFTMDRAFFTIGNLNVSQLYLTGGQGYVPFGRYRSSLVTDTGPQELGRIKTRYVQLGFKQFGEGGLYGAVYGFRSDTGTSAKNGAGGVNLGYEFIRGEFTAELVGGFVSNLAESQGMQRTGAGDRFFDGFGADNFSENIHHQVPALNVHGRLRFGNLSFLAEYTAATRAFDPRDLSFNGHHHFAHINHRPRDFELLCWNRNSNCQGAQPKAFHAEANYRFDFIGKPWLVGAGYDWTGQALALALPQNRVMLTAKTSWWRDTVQAIELRRDFNYSEGTVAGGRGTNPRVPFRLADLSGLGKTQDLISFVFAVYF